MLRDGHASENPARHDAAHLLALARSNSQLTKRLQSSLDRSLRSETMRIAAPANVINAATIILRMT